MLWTKKTAPGAGSGQPLSHVGEWGVRESSDESKQMPDSLCGGTLSFKKGENHTNGSFFKQKP